jgi:hypothetical protein
MQADTLVVFATEFGRTPTAQENDGRDYCLTDVHGHVMKEFLA